MANVRIKDLTEETAIDRTADRLAIDSAADGSRFITPRNLIGNGYGDYADSTTSGTPITPTSSTWTQLTNDGAGTYTNTTYLPAGVTSLWNTTDDEFDFSELNLGDEVDIRFDLTVTTTASNQVVRQRVQFDIGGSPYTIEFDYVQIKTAGAVPIVRTHRFHIGNAGTRDNPGQWQIWTDDSANVVVNGVYISVRRR